MEQLHKLTKEEFVGLYNHMYYERIVVYVQRTENPELYWAAVLDTLPDGRVVAVYGLDSLYLVEDTYGTEWCAWCDPKWLTA